MNGRDKPKAGKIHTPTPVRQSEAQRTGPTAKSSEATRDPVTPAANQPAVHRFASVPVHAAAAGGDRGFSQNLDRFGFDSDALTAGHLKAIEALAASIARQLQQSGPNAGVAIAATGHTDTSGTERYNQGLGQRRADHVEAALRAALIKAGVGPNQIAALVTTSAGETQPKVPTRDEVREPRNRRVEIAVTLSGQKAAIPFDALPGEPPKSQIELPDHLKLRPPGLPPRASPMPRDRIPTVPGPSQEWLENYFKNDRLLRELPKKLRDQLITPLKDVDEITASQIVQMLPIPNKDAVTAAVKALLETLKGRKFNVPQPPPVQPNFPPEHAPQHMPGEIVPTTPKIPLPKPFN